MRLGRVWFLPVFIFKSKDGWGHSLWLFIWMPDGTSTGNPVLYEHEKFHVKQSVLFLFLLPWLRRIKALNFRLEASAYGESMRALMRNGTTDLHRGNELLRWSRALASAQYGFNKTPEECAEAILKYEKSGRLV